MDALDTLNRILDNENLCNYPFRYCLVNSEKIPYRFDGERAKPNTGEDFCSLEELAVSPFLEKYVGIGISIIESKICAIDVDKCFKESFDLSSGDDRAKDIIEMFKDKAYIEFSFSGHGLRILFHVENIENYTDTYYIKNDKTRVEYYQYGNTPRYVTLTGRTIYNNALTKMTNLDTIYQFLNKYMKRPKTFVKQSKNNEISNDNDKSLDYLMKKVKSLYLTNPIFQDLWFGIAPGSGSNESQLDFHLLSMLFKHITWDKEKLRQLFELSPYFATKDKKHVNKWNYGNYRYFEYMYGRL